MTAHRRADIEAHQRGGLRIDDPGGADEDGAERNHHAGAELVDEVAFDRRQPGLYQHEQGEGDLDARRRAQGPNLSWISGTNSVQCVLDVGGGDHADHADDAAGFYPAGLVGSQAK
jgi:hypothetical protein